MQIDEFDAALACYALHQMALKRIEQSSKEYACDREKQSCIEQASMFEEASKRLNAKIYEQI